MCEWNIVLLRSWRGPCTEWKRLALTHAAVRGLAGVFCEANHGLLVLTQTLTKERTIVNETPTLMAVGDIWPVYESADQYVQLVSPVLADADIWLGQCERAYSEKGHKPNFDKGPSGNHLRAPSTHGLALERRGRRRRLARE